MTHVHISDGTRTVTVNHDGSDLDYVIQKTRRLWNNTAPPVPAPSSPGPAFGLTTEICRQWDYDHQQGAQRRPVRANGDE